MPLAHIPTARPATLINPRERALEGGPTLLLDRLQVFRAAFLADPRPGLFLEFGRLVLANEAAKKLLRSSMAARVFLDALKEGLAIEKPDPGLCLEMGSRKFQLELHPIRGRSSHAARICFLVRQAAVTSALKALTDRELGVLTWLIKGYTNRQIAERLRISIETVRKHVANALRKTGTKTRAGLVGSALKR